MAPAGAVAFLLILAASSDGGFALRYWALITILALAVLVAAQLVGGIRFDRGPMTVAVALIWAFAAWTLLSALWADSPARALEGAGRTILYAAVLTVPLVLPGRRQALWVGSAIIGGVGAIALIILIDLHANGTHLFVAGRLDSPLGYRNATATLFAFAFWPLIGFASMRGRNAPLRALAFAVAVLALGLAFLTQSRGVAIGLTLGAAVFLAIGPDRLRRIVFALVAVAGVAIVSGALLTPYDAFRDTSVVTASNIDEATNALTALTIAAFAVGLFAALLDNGLRGSRAGEAVRRVAPYGLAALGLAVVVGALVAIGNPVSYARDKWDEFTNLESQTPSGETRLGSVGGQRYDLWRVALSEFDSHPVAGVGEGNYVFGYYDERRTDRNLSDPHGLPFRLLAETGIIGLLLFSGVLVALGIAIARAARSAPDSDRRMISGLAAAGAVVVGQSLTDWLWLVPTVTGLGLLALGLAALPRGRAEDRPGPLELPGVGVRVRLIARYGFAALLAAAAVGVVFLFLSDLYVREARSEQTNGSLEAQLSDARKAADLNPVSVTPLYLEASALEGEGKSSAARDALQDALEKEPDNFVTLALLGDFLVRAGEPKAARDYYRRALALNPRDAGLQVLATGPK